MQTGSPTAIEVLALSAFALAFLFAVLWRRAATRGRRRNRVRQRRSRSGEDRAEGLLISHGYRILSRQPRVTWHMVIDGTPVAVHSRADLLVAQRRRRFVAEVKTGDRAPDPTLPATRRQLQEYARVFDVDGVLLIDMEGDRIRTVAFPDD